MSYELMKALAVQKALVADLSLKNRRLREIAEDSEKKRTDTIERLTVEESTHKLRTHEQQRLSNKRLDEAQTKLVEATQVYEATLQKLTERLMESNHRGVEALRIMKADESKYKALQESLVRQVSERDDQLAKITVVNSGLTLEVVALQETHFNESKEQQKQIDKQKSTLTILTEENLTLKADLREAAAKYSRLKTRMEIRKDRGHVMSKLEKVLTKFE